MSETSCPSLRRLEGASQALAPSRRKPRLLLFFHAAACQRYRSGLGPFGPPGVAPAPPGAQAVLVQWSLAGEGFADHPDHETQPGGAAVEQVYPWQRFPVDLGGSRGFLPGELAGRVGVGGVLGRVGGEPCALAIL